MFNKYVNNSVLILTSLISIYVLSLIYPTLIGIFDKIYELVLPILIGVALAYILNPFVDRLVSKGVKRKSAVLVSIIMFVYIIVMISIAFVPVIFKQFEQLNTNLPNISVYFEKQVNTMSKSFSFLGEDNNFTYDKIIDFVSRLTNGFLLKTVTLMIDSIVIILLAPIVAIYILFDYENIKSKVKNYLILSRHKRTYLFLKDLDNQVSGYFRGLFLVMIILSIVSSICFYILGLEMPIIFGFLVGLTNIIPIIGPYIGGSIAALFGFTISARLGVSIIITVIILQTIESNFVTPYIQSKTIDTHPLIILISFVVFGNLFGFVGMILAIPLYVLIKLIYKYYIVEKSMTF